MRLTKEHDRLVNALRLAYRYSMVCHQYTVARSHCDLDPARVTEGDVNRAKGMYEESKAKVLVAWQEVLP